MQERRLEKKYGLFTAVCMVVGIVIGAGVFFKAQTILQKTGGNMRLGIAAWLIGGEIMLSCSMAFAVMAQKFEAPGGMVGYAEAACGRRYAYFAGWFLAVIYYPCLTSVLCWLSARYTLEFVASCFPSYAVQHSACVALMAAYLLASFAVNALAPRLAGKLLTSVTVIKLIPLLLLAVVGISAGLLCSKQQLVRNFFAASTTTEKTGSALLGAVCSAAFAYEGWIVATSISAELRDAKRDLPRALVTGALIVITVYVAYYLGISGGADVQAVMERGALIAYINLFGNAAGNFLTLLVAISCLGTLNGLMLGCARGMYALACRSEGPKPKLFARIDEKSNMPVWSAVFGLCVSAAWTVYFYLANVVQLWTGPFAFDSSELPVITLYLFYIPVFLGWMKKSRGEDTLRRFVLPALALVSAGFMVFASIVSHGMANIWYLIVFAVLMLLGAPFVGKTKTAGNP